MKKLRLNNPNFIMLELGFAQWLQTLNYAPSSCYQLPSHVREYLHWLEKQNIKQLESLDSYIEYIKSRPNDRKSGGLSVAHINKQIGALKAFSKYLKLTNQGQLRTNFRSLKSEGDNQPTVLTKEQISLLYQATDNKLIGLRDRAMLAVYYGCGLRKSEGLSLEVADIHFEARLIHIRKTKNRRERKVPLALNCLQDIESYIHESRGKLLSAKSRNQQLFISERGKPISGNGLIASLNRLKGQTGNPELMDKSFGLHALRHSIATHLMEAGMKLEYIARFLGHQTLDSTQIYTHIHD